MKGPKLCPSWKCEEDAIILGVVKEDGKIAFINKKLSATKEFVQTAKQGRPPEERFRFASDCINNGCKHWQQDACHLIDVMIDALGNEIQENKELPQCSIRPECRWFGQRGVKACQVCPEVIRNL